MCGRFTMYADDAELTTLFDIDLVEGEHAPSYNQAPSDLTWTIWGFFGVLGLCLCWSWVVWVWVLGN